MFPLEWDFSNLEEIFETYIKNHKLRNEIISYQSGSLQKKYK